MLHVVRVTRTVAAAFVMAFCLTGATCGGITLGVNAPSEEIDAEFPSDETPPDQSRVVDSAEPVVSPESA